MSESAIYLGNLAECFHGLTSDRLYQGYSLGYFPMPDQHTEEIQWYRPDPRGIFPLEGFQVSRSLRKKIRRKIYQITYNANFSGVIRGCSNRPQTWINSTIMAAYEKLHHEGCAHSVEVLFEGVLVGGVYGVSFGSAFFAESMFCTMDDASKVALYYLVEQLKNKQFSLLECQFLTPHLKSLGAIEIPDFVYMNQLKKALQKRRSFL